LFSFCYQAVLVVINQYGGVFLIYVRSSMPYMEFKGSRLDIWSRATKMSLCLFIWLTGPSSTCLQSEYERTWFITRIFEVSAIFGLACAFLMKLLVLNLEALADFYIVRNKIKARLKRVLTVDTIMLFLISYFPGLRKKP